MKKVRRKVVIIVQARMMSTRLPGKVMKKVLNRPLLSYLIERLRSVNNADAVVVATTENPKDQVIADFCAETGLFFYRGEEKDVLGRYLEVAKAYQADIIVRITADCPLIDPKIIEKVINYFLLNDFDYVGNTLILTYPRGMDTEVFSFKTLEIASLKADQESEREHVTLYMYRNPQQFRLGNVAYPVDKSSVRLTVDTPEDFLLIQTVIEHLYPINHHYTLEDILEFLENNPQLAQINRHIAQKNIKEN